MSGIMHIWLIFNQKVHSDENEMNYLEKLAKGQPAFPERGSIDALKGFPTISSLWKAEEEVALFGQLEIKEKGFKNRKIADEQDTPRMVDKNSPALLQNSLLKDFTLKEICRLKELTSPESVHPNLAAFRHYSPIEKTLSVNCKQCIQCTLLEYCWKDKPCLKDRIQYYVDLADAVNYLHRNAFIVGGLRASQIYMTGTERSASLRVIIGQLGRATMLSDEVCAEDLSSATVLPIMPNIPETSFRRYPIETNLSGFMSMRTDVYGYGLTMWECERAVARDSKTFEQQTLAPRATISLFNLLAKQLEMLTRPACPAQCPRWLNTLILMCTSSPAFRRPLMPLILEIFNNTSMDGRTRLHPFLAASSQPGPSVGNPGSTTASAIAYAGYVLESEERVLLESLQSSAGVVEGNPIRREKQRKGTRNSMKRESKLIAGRSQSCEAVLTDVAEYRHHVNPGPRFPSDPLGYAAYDGDEEDGDDYLAATDDKIEEEGDETFEENDTGDVQLEAIPDGVVYDDPDEGFLSENSLDPTTSQINSNEFRLTRSSIPFDGSRSVENVGSEYLTTLIGRESQDVYESLTYIHL